MSAIPRDVLPTAALAADATRPFPRSRKVHVAGSRADVRVPMREVAQTATRTAAGEEPNPPVVVYDTSGPYTDPSLRIDLHRGLPPLRARWIEERADSESLAAEKRGQTPISLPG